MEIQRTKNFKIDGKTFTVNFPTVGQIIDIEGLKQAMTNNKYGAMASSGIVSMYYALDFVDSASFLQVCCPAVARYFDITNYMDLTPEKMEMFVNVYKEEILPWYKDTLDQLRKVGKDEQSTEDNKSN